MAGSGSVEQRKKLLTVSQQIEHLKSKGVTFELCSEEEAAEYLSERTYFFKLAAYRTLFEKRVGGPRDGQYSNLDFGHLRALASLDRDLRYALLPLTLDVEHAARTKLMRTIAGSNDEDGYSVVRDYMASLNHNERRRREGEIGMMSNDLFCGDLVKKYGGNPADMPIWVLMELFSFGSFINLYLFCAERWGDREMVHEHYMLRQAKSVRNACAHSSDILNGIAAVDTRINADAAIMAALAEIGLSHRVRTAKMKNPRTRQIATLMYLHAELVTCEPGKRRTSANLARLKERMHSTAELIQSNDVVQSSFAFFEYGVTFLGVCVAPPTRIAVWPPDEAEHYKKDSPILWLVQSLKEEGESPWQMIPTFRHARQPHWPSYSSKRRAWQRVFPASSPKRWTSGTGA